MANKPYKCRECGNDTFQEVEYVPMTRPIAVHTGDDGKPHYTEPDYLHDSEAHHDGALASHVECSSCCAPLPGESELPERLRALERVAQGVPTRDEWRSPSGFMENVAAALDRVGVERPEHYDD